MVFEDGKVYRITSAADGAVLDLPDSNVYSGNQLITYQDNGGSNQKWVARSEAHGYYLQTLVHAHEIKVVDHRPQYAALVIWTWDQEVSQQWHTHEVSPGSNIYTIFNGTHDKVITAHGRGNKVTCEKEDSTNVWQRWKIQCCTP